MFFVNLFVLFTPRYVERNRYCNQYPFDSNAVTLKSVPYINASWMNNIMPGVDDARKTIITMGPLHPSNHHRKERARFTTLRQTL
jgi:protein tyrosine phosphatase